MEKVLIVDDTDSVREALRFRLKSDYELKIASSVEMGLQFLSLDSQEPDPRKRFSIALIDLHFKNYNHFDASDDAKMTAGLNLVRAARKDRHLEVILMTAYGTESSASKFLEVGGFRHVKKTLDIQEAWLVKVKNAVKEAAAVRERWLSLEEDILQVKATADKMATKGHISSGELLMVTSALVDASTHLSSLIHTRGRKIDPDSKV